MTHKLWMIIYVKKMSSGTNWHQVRKKKNLWSKSKMIMTCKFPNIFPILDTNKCMILNLIKCLESRESNVRWKLLKIKCISISMIYARFSDNSNSVLHWQIRTLIWLVDMNIESELVWKPFKICRIEFGWIKNEQTSWFARHRNEI